MVVWGRTQKHTDASHSPLPAHALGRAAREPGGRQAEPRRMPRLPVERGAHPHQFGRAGIKSPTNTNTIVIPLTGGLRLQRGVDFGHRGPQAVEHGGHALLSLVLYFLVVAECK